MNAGLLTCTCPASLVDLRIIIDHCLGSCLFYYGYGCNTDTCGRTARAGDCDCVKVGRIESANDHTIDRHLVMLTVLISYIAAGSRGNCQFSEIAGHRLFAKRIDLCAFASLCPCSVGIGHYDDTCAHACGSKTDCCRTCSGEDQLLCLCGYLNAAVCLDLGSCCVCIIVAAVWCSDQCKYVLLCHDDCYRTIDCCAAAGYANTDHQIDQLVITLCRHDHIAVIAGCDLSSLTNSCVYCSLIYDGIDGGTDCRTAVTDSQVSDDIDDIGTSQGDDLHVTIGINDCVITNSCFYGISNHNDCCRTGYCCASIGYAAADHNIDKLLIGCCCYCYVISINGYMVTNLCFRASAGDHIGIGKTNSRSAGRSCYATC